MKKIGSFIDKFCTSVLLVTVFSMIGLSLFSIIARLFSITSMWIDPLLRHLVFLSAFLGGVLAIGSDKHIKIDVISKFIEYKYRDNTKIQAIYQFVTLMLTLVIVYVLAKAGLEFFQTEKKFGQDAFLGLHSSTLTAIIPIGFILLLARGFVRGWGIFKFEENK